MNTKVFLAAMVSVMLAWFVIPAGAEDITRTGKSEIYFVYQTLGGDSTEGSDLLGSQVTMEFDDSAVYGAGVGFNLSDNFNINTDLLFGSMDTKGTIDDSPVSGDTDLMLWNFNIDYNIFKDRLTPVISGGIGVATVTTDLDGDEASLLSFDESNFSYNIGAGVRWDITDNLLIKAMYRLTWINLNVTDDTVLFDGFMLCAGLRF